MKKQFIKKSLLAAFLLILLVAALAVSMISCNKEENETETPETTVETTADTAEEPIETEVGEGQMSFTFKVKFKDGSERTYLVKTDSTNVGTALIDAGLISGEDGAYGLYVKTVAGETLDYNTDGKYWAFYENDAYAMKGVELTTIVGGVVYSFIAS